MKDLKRFIELLKLPPTILIAISLVTGLILFLPDIAIGKLYMLNLKAKFGLLIGIMFLLSTIMLLVLLIHYFCKIISKKINNKKLIKNQIKYLKELDKTKTNFIKEFIKEESHTLNVCMNNGSVIELSYFGLISIAGGTQLVNIDFDNSINAKYFLQPWVLKRINQDEALKKKFL